MRSCQRKSSSFTIEIRVVVNRSVILLARSFRSWRFREDWVIPVYLTLDDPSNRQSQYLLYRLGVLLGVLFQELVLSFSHRGLDDLHLSSNIFNAPCNLSNSPSWCPTPCQDFGH